MSTDWEIVVRLRVPNLCDPTQPDARAIAEWCIREEGLYGVADFDTMEIVSLKPWKESGE